MSGKAAHRADARKREKFRQLHPEGRKEFARAKKKLRQEKRDEKRRRQKAILRDNKSDKKD